MSCVLQTLAIQNMLKITMRAFRTNATPDKLHDANESALSPFESIQSFLLESKRWRRQREGSMNGAINKSGGRSTSAAPNWWAQKQPIREWPSHLHKRWRPPIRPSSIDSTRASIQHGHRFNTGIVSSGASFQHELRFNTAIVSSRTSFQRHQIKWVSFRPEFSRAVGRQYFSLTLYQIWFVMNWAWLCVSLLY